MRKQEEMIRIFPDYMKRRWEQAFLYGERLQEIRLGVGQPVRLKFGGEEKFISAKGLVSTLSADVWYVTEKEIEDIVKNICRYSLYAFENEIRQGFLTVPGGHRIGMAGQVVLNEKGGIRTISHIRYLNIRISHEVLGAAEEIMPHLYDGDRVRNTLLISPPGCGKTTILRDMIRQMSDGNVYGAGRQIGVVDERSEIAGSFLGTPQNNIGMRTDVLDACPKAQGMMLLMRSMAPAVVAVDEIGGAEDAKALFQVLQCGSSVVATMHGDSMKDVKNHLDFETYGALFERYVFLEKKQGVCGIREIMDGRGKDVLWREGKQLCCG